MLTITNLKVAYKNNLVLKGLNLTAEEGEIHGILGMNGSGKSTFFNALYRFLPVVAGEISFNSKTIHQKDIAYLETHHFFYSYMTGEEYLQLCALQNPSFNIKEWNQIFNLPLKTMVDTYSTGMKKKLAFIGNIALNRPIMVLDEPYNGVDFESCEIIYEILLRLRKQGKVILISSHIIESLTNVCDRVSYLNNGLIEREYLTTDFKQMEQDLRDFIKSKVENNLDSLFSK
jgi:ABC-2 type transport system ATP-binding protein